MNKKILILAAHSDDEALGAGGTIARHAAQGDHVECVFLTNGVGARDAKKSEIEQRVKAAHKAADILGIRKIHAFDFPDNKMDSVPLLDIVQAIEPVIAQLRPELIYTHHAHDLNIDHRLAFQAVMTACRPQAGHSVKEIYSFEVPSSTEWAAQDADAFKPNVFIDISQTFDKKMEALRAYEAEMRASPHPRSYDGVEALAQWRGACIGVEYAESLQAVRLIK